MGEEPMGKERQEAGYFDWESQYALYRGVWESRQKKGQNPSEAAWDGRAADWKKELSKDPAFFGGLDRRVRETVSFLRGRGLLQPGSTVADIGCGPGHFAAAFAETAAHVAALDISGGMLEMAREYAAAQGVKNVSFVQADFSSMDVGQAGWERAFDLVFAALTPAVASVEDLEKLMGISRGFCFNSSFVRWEDGLERRIGRELYGREPRPLRGRDDWFYACFNLLWIMGYYPETRYYCTDSEVRVRADEDEARYYARCFSPDMSADAGETERIYRYLQGIAGKDGMISFREEKWYGWLLWDVRKKTVRR